MILIPYSEDYYNTHKDVIEKGIESTGRYVPDTGEGIRYVYFIARSLDSSPLGFYMVKPMQDGVSEVGVRLWSMRIPMKMAVESIMATLSYSPGGLMARVDARNKNVKSILQRLGFTYRGRYQSMYPLGLQLGYLSGIAVELYTLSVDDFMQVFQSERRYQQWQQKSEQQEYRPEVN